MIAGSGALIDFGRPNAATPVADGKLHRPLREDALTRVGQYLSLGFEALLSRTDPCVAYPHGGSISRKLTYFYAKKNYYTLRSFPIGAMVDFAFI